MTRPLVEVISFCLLLTGVALSMWGTYLLTHLYHSYGPLDFVKACFRTVFYAIVGKFRKAGRLAKIASSHGAIVPEQRDKALLGLYLVFLGFVVQGAGTILGLVDIWMGMAARTQTCAGAAFYMFRPL